MTPHNLMLPSCSRAVLAKPTQNNETFGRAQVLVNSETLARLDAGGRLAPLCAGSSSLTADERALKPEGPGYSR